MPLSRSASALVYLQGARGYRRRRVPDEPVPDDAAGLRAANARLRAVVEAKDGQVAMLTAALERERRLAPPPAEAERLWTTAPDLGEASRGFAEALRGTPAATTRRSTIGCTLQRSTSAQACTAASLLATFRVVLSENGRILDGAKPASPRPACSAG